MKAARIVSVALVALAFTACGDGDKKLELGGSCSLNSDCAEGLLCKFGACHKACVKSVDCAAGERCVQVDGVAVCQAAACAPGCPAPLVCREVDNTCRNRCTTTDDCLGGQTCTGGFCVEYGEADARQGGDTGPGGGPDAGVDAVPDAPLVAPGIDGGPPDLMSAPDVDAAVLVADGHSGLESSGAAPNGLVAYYPFTGNANDESGTGNHGRVFGATLAPDRRGNADRAYSFDGIDDYVDCGNAASLNLTSGISILVWLRTPDTNRPQ